MDTAVSVELFVEILNRYVYYYEQENDAVSTCLFRALIVTDNALGDNEVPQWPDRAHPFQFKYE